MPDLQTEFDFERAGPPSPVAGFRAPRVGVSLPELPLDAEPATARRPVHPTRGLTRAGLESALRLTLGEPVSLVITDNERTMISTRRRPGLRQVRLHHMFLGADGRTVAALAGYLGRSDPQAGDVLGSFIETHRARIRRRGPRRIRIADGGEHHNLQSIFEALNAQYFDGRVKARITWARRGAAAGRQRRSIKLGSYNSRDELIRVHPTLDAKWVPHFFVAYIVYHEMLHQVVPPRVSGAGGSRRELHGRDFCRAERVFEQYDEAIAWEKQNLRRLLRT